MPRIFICICGTSWISFWLLPTNSHQHHVSKNSHFSMITNHGIPYLLHNYVQLLDEKWKFFYWILQEIASFYIFNIVMLFWLCKRYLVGYEYNCVSHSACFKFYWHFLGKLIVRHCKHWLTYFLRIAPKLIGFKVNKRTGRCINSHCLLLEFTFTQSKVVERTLGVFAKLHFKASRDWSWEKLKPVIWGELFFLP